MSSNFQGSYTALATRAAEEHMPARAGLCPEPKWDLRAEERVREPASVEYINRQFHSFHKLSRWRC